MHAHLHLALGQERLQTLRAEAQRARQAREARPERRPSPRLQGVLAFLHLSPRPA
ncbi:hypothetical protein [Deinococcus planocerae]|uniref:hypothetical protein n=1 Tax=Deinococcus planocerae TaxID=1737569 RepID=UPI0015E12586|nr:hypothetical protein [Deinococcus planocerae]